MSSESRSQFLPVASLLLAACFWGVSWYPLRLLAEAGLDGVWTTLIAWGVISLAVVPWLRAYWPELRQHWPSLLAIGFTAGWCNLAFVLAMLDGQVVRILLLFYLSPLWATLLAVHVLGERLSLQGVVALVVAMFGAGLMLWSPEVGLPWPRGVAEWLAISSGLAFAIANVLIRQAQHIRIFTKNVVTWWGGFLLAAGGVALYDLPPPAVGNTAILGAIALGIFGFALATFAVQYGVSRLPVQRSALILLFELVAGVASAQWLSDEVVRPIEWVGGTLILFAAWFTVRRQNGAG